MRITVITINFNNKYGLLNTLNSVSNQTVKPFEYIVIDGNSLDGSIDIILKFKGQISKWISETDSGIYNAMNKAVKIAKGDYCLFLNSGDIFYSRSVIKELEKVDFDFDFVLGSVITKQGKLLKPKQSISFMDLYYGSIAHQASIIKRRLLLETPLDENLKIVSDWKFSIQMLILNNCSYCPIPNIICIEEKGGVSTDTNNNRIERETVLKSLFPERIIIDYKLNYILFRLKKIIFKLGIIK